MKIFVTILANELMLCTDVFCYWNNKIIKKKTLVNCVLCPRPLKRRKLSGPDLMV